MEKYKKMFLDLHKELKTENIGTIELDKFEIKEESFPIGIDSNKYTERISTGKLEINIIIKPMDYNTRIVGKIKDKYSQKGYLTKIKNIFKKYLDK